MLLTTIRRYNDLKILQVYNKHSQVQQSQDTTSSIIKITVTKTVYEKKVSMCSQKHQNFK